jgi:glutathione synthase
LGHNDNTRCSYHVRVHRATFAALGAAAAVSSTGELELRDPLDNSPFAVSVVYFRAGYGPDDYKGQSDWDTRALLERSAAIKCPSVALQLAGAKRVQQALAAPGVLERFLLDPARGAVLPATDVDALRESFMGMWPLDNSDEGREGTRLAQEEAHRFVLKPMREGGGNNVYRGDIPRALAEMRARDAAAGPGADEKQTYILMELIDVPPSSGAYLLRAPPGGTRDNAPEAAAVRAEDTVSELGTYGFALFRAQAGRAEELRMHSEGHLLRTKARESDEGGVAVGFSVLDSPLLV